MVSEGKFWQNLGRGVGYGLRKAKKIGEKISDQAEGLLDLREAREKLETLHRNLGERIARRALDAEDDFPLPADEELAKMLEEIAHTHEQIARQEELAAAKSEAESEETAASDSAD